MFRQTRWGGRAIIGDSIIATLDTYDQQVYAVGKGPSSVTVSAPDIAAPFGNAVVIKGTVMDVSPGTNSDAMKLRFPNGVAAVSDQSQSDWMLYVYKQFAQPGNITGVPVSIDATDPNNNYIHIGDTTTDMSGQFSYMYTPTLSGKYTVYATFAGSAAYYGSYAEAPLGVAQQASPTPSPSPIAASVSDTYLIPGIIAIIIAIIAIGVILSTAH